MDQRRSNGRRSVPRLSPYGIVFGAETFGAEHFPAIGDEAEERGADTSDPSRFLLLGSVGWLLREMLPEDAPGAAAGRHGKLLFHGYHFWRFGRRSFLLDLPVARYLVESSPRLGDWELIPPCPAGYLQLPANLFWATVAESGPPEPIDGFFWTMVGQEDDAAPPYARLDLLLALGVRAGRPGFSVVDVGAELASQPPGHWGDVDARPDGRDFENVLPGGEIEGLYALVTVAEALRLASLVFWYVANHPEAVTVDTRPAGSDVPAVERPGRDRGPPAGVAAGGPERGSVQQEAPEGGGRPSKGVQTDRRSIIRLVGA